MSRPHRYTGGRSTHADRGGPVSATRGPPTGRCVCARAVVTCAGGTGLACQSGKIVCRSRYRGYTFGYLLQLTSCRGRGAGVAGAGCQSRLETPPRTVTLTVPHTDRAETGGETHLHTPHTHTLDQTHSHTYATPRTPFRLFVWFDTSGGASAGGWSWSWSVEGCGVACAHLIRT